MPPLHKVAIPLGAIAGSASERARKTKENAENPTKSKRYLKENL